MNRLVRFSKWCIPLKTCIRASTLVVPPRLQSGHTAAKTHPTSSLPKAGAQLPGSPARAVFVLARDGVEVPLLERSALKKGYTGSGNALILRLALALTAGVLLQPTTAATQASPTSTKAAHVRITQGPEIERADPDFAIIRWTSNNPGGSPEHYGVVQYGTDPKQLGQTAKSPIRLNPGHRYTVFRVRVDGLKPQTTYYYTVDSIEANGKSDGVKSTIKHFTTPE